MSEIMYPIPFAGLVEWIQAEHRKTKSVFGVREEKFYRNAADNRMTLFGQRIASPVGPAAGPNSQLTQNIVAAYLGGSRFIELKTVQTMDGEDLRKCVARPCIYMTDEGYNVEWSTELTVRQAFDEYVKAWFLLHVFGKEFGLSESCDFIFNVSVGYSLEGIQSPKIDNYLEGMKDASKTAVWKECYGYLAAHIGDFTRFTKADLDKISPAVATSATLSTLHGCPREEIEKIAYYLLTEKGFHTYIKCNPTLLGYEAARQILDSMGFTYVSFDDHHFKEDLQFGDAVEMLKRLMKTAKERSLGFGVKITNTFPVEIRRQELPGEEMYMSGRSIFPLSLNVAKNISAALGGELPISYSGGADFFNLASLIETGIRPITFASTILKPGGYERVKQLAEIAEKTLDPKQAAIDVGKLSALAESLPQNKRYRKEYRQAGSRKTASELPLFDCAKSPCSDGGCPINQQIPAYLEKTAAGDYAGAFKIIAADNAAPSITGTLCPHTCQLKCTRVDYDDSLAIRRAKLLAAENAQSAYTASLKAAALKTDKSVGVVGAGPAGIAAALYLRRAGVPVTVYEKRDAPFGVVRHVIPAFRIGLPAIERDYEMAVKSGVAFSFNTEVQSLAPLKAKHAFVVAATGAWKAGEAPVAPTPANEGKSLDAISFLADSKRTNLALDLGKHVIVVGGGDVAMDCARAAKRNKGVEKVTVVYRRTVNEMPAQAEERELALADGIELVELCAPKTLSGGRLTCEVMRLGAIDASGRRGVSGTGATREFVCDTLIGATGAKVDGAFFTDNGLALDAKGLPTVSETLESQDGVYVAGDCKAGPATVVKAMADGKTVALAILAKLGLEAGFAPILPENTDTETLYAKKGVIAGEQDGNTDGSRCLSCSSLCEVCVDVCPNRANAVIEAAGFAQRHQVVHIDRSCNECGNCATFCPHAGRPYKDKFTVFSTEAAFKDSENPGFAANGGAVRLKDGSVVSEKDAPADVRGVIAVIRKDYAYLTV
ncbi:MAG: putative selenate reductase subunit YgfK [Spirochaetaceae bacterium]|jgi:putative selenate reductase|nr:putative selenate reductase subunit YgfK [Spirochaetaceae bacterium]